MQNGDGGLAGPGVRDDDPIDENRDSGDEPSGRIRRGGVWPDRHRRIYDPAAAIARISGVVSL